MGKKLEPCNLMLISNFKIKGQYENGSFKIYKVIYIYIIYLLSMLIEWSKSYVQICKCVFVLYLNFFYVIFM